MGDPEEPIPKQAVVEPAAASLISVPDHELLRVIGKGNYGEVWLAKNRLGAFRAVKIVSERTFRHKRPFEREFNGVKKFEPISRLHEGLVDILQVGGDDAGSYFYCVMELADDAVSGAAIDPDRYAPRTLATDIARHKRLPVDECRRVGVAVAQALDFLHQRGLIHRDVKPSNIVFVDGVPKLADIGLVAEMTEARSYVGTEGFIPPEGPGTAQADLYSLGKVLYEISTGKDRHDFPELPTLVGDARHEAELAALNRIILKACRSDVPRRYHSAEAMLTDLLALEEADGLHQPIGRRAMRIGIGALIMASLLGAAGFAMMSKNRVAHGSGRRAEPKSLTTGLVSYWAGEGNGWDDAGVNDGDATGGVDYAPGQVGRAFLFNGTNAQVRFDAVSALDVGAGEAFTLAAWINPADVSTRCPLFEWNDGEGAWGVHLYIDPFCSRNEVNPGALFANLADTYHNWHAIKSGRGIIVSNVFQHVALTFEKHFDKDHSIATLYCNGAVVARQAFEAFTPLTSFDLYLGRRPSAEFATDTWTFKGLIDEPALFNRALSSNEIRVLYETGSAGRRALSAPTTVPAPPGLVSWWPGASNATDIVGGNDGTLMSGAAYGIGRVGEAFDFRETTNAYVEVPDSAPLRLTKELTIEFWVQRHKPFGADYVVEKGGDWTFEKLNYGVGIATQVHRFKNVLFFAFAGGIRHSTTITDPRWHHCAVTARDGDADPVFYIDGVRQPVTRSEGATKINLYPSTAPLHIGALVDSSSDYNCSGTATIDELCIYSRVLSAAEIESIYRAGRAGKRILPKTAAR